MRINKFLASCGLGSRRGVEEFINQGKIIINGEICSDFGRKINDTDKVEYNGQIIQQKKLEYVAFHKPFRVETTKSISKSSKNIYDFIPQYLHHLNYSGRLDKDSKGLLILSNDGEFISKIQHPRFKCEKEYQVITDKPIKFKDMNKLQKGFEIKLQDIIYLNSGGKKIKEQIKFAHMKEISTSLKKNQVKIVLTQGLKRQIRVMLDVLGYNVKSLIRTRIGNLQLGDLKEGEWKKISQSKVL